MRSRRSLVIENVALRQQVAVLQRPRPRLEDGDRWFWMGLCRLWSGWREVLVVVQPETVVR